MSMMEAGRPTSADLYEQKQANKAVASRLNNCRAQLEHRKLLERDGVFPCTSSNPFSLIPFWLTKCEKISFGLKLCTIYNLLPNWMLAYTLG